MSEKGLERCCRGNEKCGWRKDKIIFQEEKGTFDDVLVNIIDIDLQYPNV